MPRPLLIGVSARIYHPRRPVLDLGGVWTRTLHYLEQSVAHWLMSPQVLAVMIPAVESESLVRRSDLSLHGYAEALDGLLLQGGNDIAPESYGETPLHPDWAGDRVRDRYELDLLNRFVQAGKPVLGICRGCQLINVAFGGTLYQDIPTQRPGDTLHLHGEHYEHNMHALNFVAGTRLARLYPERSGALVNSIHHQAVKALGRDLVVEAHADDGLIEAIRWTGPGWVFGMQWHPEFIAREGPHETQLEGGPILDDFLAAARAVREGDAGPARAGTAASGAPA
jgi:putative glutamine amidotransferase